MVLSLPDQRRGPFTRVDATWWLVGRETGWGAPLGQYAKGCEEEGAAD